MWHSVLCCIIAHFSVWYRTSLEGGPFVLLSLRALLRGDLRGCFSYHLVLLFHHWPYLVCTGQSHFPLLIFFLKCFQCSFLHRLLKSWRIPKFIEEGITMIQIPNTQELMTVHTSGCLFSVYPFIFLVYFNTLKKADLSPLTSWGRLGRLHSKFPSLNLERHINQASVAMLRNRRFPSLSVL